VTIDTHDWQVLTSSQGQRLGAEPGAAGSSTSDYWPGVTRKYVHGYSQRETLRLQEQSAILEDLLHHDTSYPPGSRVLEAGCGVGGQTILLAARSPQAEFTSIDVSRESLVVAAATMAQRGVGNVRFYHADVINMPFRAESFDHVFVCFLLEHLDEPLGALAVLRSVLKPGGTITVIEGDHGSCFWHPQTRESLQAWHSLIASQFHLGHDPLIGRKLCPLLTQADFDVREATPRWVYTDSRNPGLRDGVLNKIIVPMTQTARQQALDLGIIDKHTFDTGIDDLRRSGMPPDGTFFYTWFKAVGVKRS